MRTKCWNAFLCFVPAIDRCPCSIWVWRGGGVVEGFGLMLTVFTHSNCVRTSVGWFSLCSCVTVRPLKTLHAQKSEPLSSAVGAPSKIKKKSRSAGAVAPSASERCSSLGAEGKAESRRSPPKQSARERERARVRKRVK